MDEIFSEYDASSHLCQGDVIRAYSLEGAAGIRLGLILTADCDIAQDKVEYISILEVISAQDYLLNIWSKREVKRIYDRSLQKALIFLNTAIANLASGSDELEKSDLIDWLSRSGSSGLLEAVGVEIRPQSEIYTHLQCIEACGRLEDQTDLASLVASLWKIQNLNEKQRANLLNDALNSTRGAGDVYILPFLPGLSEAGWIIRLRNVAGVKSTNIYPDLTSARVAAVPGSFYRIARLQDGVRFSIVQKLANLFSRIGLSEQFENETEIASQLAAQEFHEKLFAE